MPFPNEHSARLVDPGRFVRFRRRNNAGGRGVHFIFGIRRNGSTQVQAIRFDASRFTASQARRWLREHGRKPVRFEPARQASSSDQAGEDMMHAAKSVHGVIDAAAEISVSEIKEDASGSSFGEVEGMASTFGNRDLQDDIVERGAFKKFLESTKPGSGSWPAMLWQHNPGEPIGVWDEMHEEGKGLRVKGRILLEVQRAREVHELLKAGAVTGLSIGYRADRWEIDEKRKVRRLQEVTLKEVSPVVFPANVRARVTRAKSLEEEGVRCVAVQFWDPEDATARILEWAGEDPEKAWIADAPAVFDVIDGDLVVVPAGVVRESEIEMIEGGRDRSLLDECWEIMGIDPPWRTSPASSFVKAAFLAPATRREMEWCLRDAGMSRKAAKAMSTRWDGIRETRDDELDRVLAAIREARSELASNV